MGFSREEYLEWIAISFSRGSSQLRDQTQVSRFTVWATREAQSSEGAMQWGMIPFPNTKVALLSYFEMLKFL